MSPRPWLKSDPAQKNISYRQQNQTKNKAAASEVPVLSLQDTSEQGEGVGEKAAPGQGRDPSPCAASTPVDPAESGRRFYSQEEGGGGGREEELSVVVSQNREVQRPGGD